MGKKAGPMKSLGVKFHCILRRKIIFAYLLCVGDARGWGPTTQIFPGAHSGCLRAWKYKKKMTIEKIFEFATKPEQLRLSSSIRLESMIKQICYIQIIHIQYINMTKVYSYVHSYVQLRQNFPVAQV